MGCTSSKLDDLPAVALCRDRCSFLDEAIHQRYSLAEAHIGYIHSLKGIGQSLSKFIEYEVGNSSSGSPTLNLPPLRKGDQVSKSSPNHHRHSHSNSGSHIHFHSDSDDDDSLHHSDHSSPMHHIDGDYQGSSAIPYPNPYPNQYSNSPYPETDSYPGSSYMQMNYMRNKATPSVVYQQKPMSSENVYHMGESSSSSSYYGAPNGGGYYGNSYQNGAPSNSYPGGGGGYYGNSSPPQPGYGGGGYAAPAAPASSKPPPPPPPPSPPRASAWDFINPFESIEPYYSSYTPSRNSKEVREEEGIPDLEDEEYNSHYNHHQQYQQEVLKEVRRDHPKVAPEHVHHPSKAVQEDEEAVETQASLYQTRPRPSVEEGGGVEYEVHVVDKKVVDEEEKREDHHHRGGGGGGPSAFKPGSRDAVDVAREIQAQFQRASESGNEIAGMLEVGKHPHNWKHVPSMLSMVSSQPSTSNSVEESAGPAQLGFDEELMMRSKNLSSTLHKLYLWEKKLYNEVKTEEKMRVAHERKVRKLKRLDERGAEPNKVDTTRTLIRSLSTKIKIAIQVVDKISVTINKIRDEELWPQLNELIQGLTRMWKSMLECHRSQCLAIKEARGLGPIGSGKRLSDAHVDATLEFERELVNWTFRFSTWISAQKGYVRALNNWLLKCLLYEPEETADGIVPFSPGRIGAPPVFVICNQWSQALERISEREVVDSMRVFTMSVLQSWEQGKQDMRERMQENQDMQKKFKNLDKKDQKLQKQIQALDKKVVLVSGDIDNPSASGQIVYQSETRNSTLQASLQRIFEAMERFMDVSTKTYEELLQRNEEESLVREHEAVS